MPLGLIVLRWFSFGQCQSGGSFNSNLIRPFVYKVSERLYLMFVLIHHLFNGWLAEVKINPIWLVDNVLLLMGNVEIRLKFLPVSYFMLV
jgi:hypothetical protein